MTNNNTTTDVNEITVSPQGSWIDRHNGAYGVDSAVLRRVCDYGYCCEDAVGILVRGWECRPMCESHGAESERFGGIRTGTFVFA